jgi:ribose transport system permease protein
MALAQLGRKRRNVDLIVRLFLAGVVVAVFAVYDPEFRTLGNAYAVLDNFALSGLIALGLGITMIAGEFDISVGATVPLAGLVTLLLLPLGIASSMIIAVLLICCFGLAQGLVIAILRISSLPVTIATLIAGGGLTYVVAHNVPLELPLQYISLANGMERRLWIFSPISLGVIGIYVVFGGFLRYTRSGREIYAIGSGRTEAFAAGVSRLRPLVLVFVVSAAFAAVTGGVVAVTSGGMSLGAQESLLLGAVTAALIGGVGLEGGRGTVLGIAAGVLILSALQSEITLRALPAYDQQLASGAVLLLVLSAEMLLRARRRGTAVVQMVKVESG